MTYKGGLDERKLRILRAIIDDYIDTAEPVGSRTIAKKHKLGLSSATIRNEMADLEELGLLEQPHTSAGRIPSDKGYRLYVDQLMKIRELTMEEIQLIKSELEVKITELGQLLKQVSAVLSRLTHYTSMAVTPPGRRSYLKSLQVVPIEVGKAVIILVTNSGIVRHRLIKIPDHLFSDFLMRLTVMLNENLSGLTIEKIDIPKILDMDRELGIDRQTLLTIMNEIVECICDIDNMEIYLEGTTNIFDHPEFRDVTRAKELLDTLDEKETLLNLLNNMDGHNTINIRIGSENELDKIKDCSLITVRYSVGNAEVGTIGVIGPTRMEYSKVISSLHYIRNVINKEIKKLLDGNDLEDGTG